MQLTNRRVLELVSAFKLLLGRSLTPISAQRAAILYRSLLPVAESYDEAVKPLQAREAAARKSEDEAFRESELSAVMAEFDALLSATVDVPDPKVRLAQHDLPKASKKDDLTNTAGNGIIQATLAPEFFDLTDPDAGSPDDE